MNENWNEIRRRMTMMKTMRDEWKLEWLNNAGEMEIRMTEQCAMINAWSMEIRMTEQCAINGN